MSTPNEGPAPQRTAQEQRAADIFNSLSDSQRVAMMRAIRTHEILAPVHTAIERSVAYTRASIEGLSDYAQQLAVGARALHQSGKDGFEAGKQKATDSFAAGKQAVASGFAAGREVAGKAGRWFNNQISNAASKASATFAGIAQRRMDPALRGPDLSLPDNLRVNQHLTEIASAQTPEQLNTAMGNLSTFANERLSQMQGANAGVAEAQNAARVAFSGVGERAGESRAQATTGQAQADQGAAARPNLTKAEPKGPKIGG